LTSPCALAGVIVIAPKRAANAPERWDSTDSSTPFAVARSAGNDRRHFNCSKQVIVWRMFSARSPAPIRQGCKADSCGTRKQSRRLGQLRLLRFARSDRGELVVRDPQLEKSKAGRGLRSCPPLEEDEVVQIQPPLRWARWLVLSCLHCIGETGGADVDVVF
jgi:hypothetical protein